MVFAQLYLIAGVLIVAGIATPLFVLLRRPDESDPRRASSHRARMIGSVIFAIIAIAIGSTIFYLGEVAKKAPRGPEHTHYRNLVTVRCPESPDARIYFGVTLVGTGTAEIDVSGDEEYCVPLPLEPTIPAIEKAIFATLPDGSVVEHQARTPNLWFNREHACDLVGVYHVRHPDRCLDVLGIYAGQAGDRAFAVPIRIRSAEKYALSASQLSGSLSVSDLGPIVSKPISTDTDTYTFTVLPGPAGDTSWISRFPEDAERLETTP